MNPMYLTCCHGGKRKTAHLSLLIVASVLAGCATTTPPLVCPQPQPPLVVPEILMLPPGQPPALMPNTLTQASRNGSCLNTRSSMVPGVLVACSGYLHYSSC